MNYQAFHTSAKAPRAFWICLLASSVASPLSDTVRVFKISEICCSFYLPYSLLLLAYLLNCLRVLLLFWPSLPWLSIQTSILIAYGHICVQEDIYHQHTQGLWKEFIHFDAVPLMLSFITLFKILSRTSRNNRGDRRQCCLAPDGNAEILTNTEHFHPTWNRSL
jgi:hypothetical protein